MFTLDSGNVLLKPSHRKQVLTWLRRTLRLAQRVGGFLLSISMKRVGKFYEVSVAAKDSIGSMTGRARRHDWRDALRDLVRRLTQWLHAQHLAIR
jgi:hypothetical protein